MDGVYGTENPEEREILRRSHPAKDLHPGLLKPREEVQQGSAGFRCTPGPPRPHHRSGDMGGRPA